MDVETFKRWKITVLKYEGIQNASSFAVQPSFAEMEAGNIMNCIRSAGLWTAEILYSSSLWIPQTSVALVNELL